MSNAWWEKISGDQLSQGDLLEACHTPIFQAIGSETVGTTVEVDLAESRLIIVTQTCDLSNDKVEHVALCPIHRLEEYESLYPERGSSKWQIVWEEVRKGRRVGLHLLASPETPADNRSAFVVDFGQIISLPLDYLSQHADSLGERWRLQPPFLEHFSQAFARFFMRVGLPSDIPPFK